jgi:hypothetical protein
VTAIDHAVGILGLSCGFWMIFGLITGLSVQRFIVKRYEKETDLSQTIYFSQFMPFAKYLPDFFSSPLYMGHLSLSGFPKPADCPQAKFGEFNSINGNLQSPRPLQI